MTRIDAAIVREQGVEFTVVSVKASAVATTHRSRDVIRGLSQYFPGRPIVLAARVGGRTQFVGRRDLVNWLARIEMWRLPWKTYTFRN